MQWPQADTSHALRIQQVEFKNANKKEQLVYGVFAQRRQVFQLRHLSTEQVLSSFSLRKRGTAPVSTAAASEARD